jgi:hypothetical protein
MGLLDDAIREHLELKRLRGADPGAVAREEQDALGPVLLDGAPAEPSETAGEEAPPRGGPSSTAEAKSLGAPSEAGQETIEINMEAELAAAGRDPAGEHGATPPSRAVPAAHPAQVPKGTEDSLEWEVPGEHPPESQTGEGSSPGDPPHVLDEHVEDVLEETPDFLRDTPEQERLWFEQRPPRDFDFNE